MIFARIPYIYHIIDFPLGRTDYQYLVVIPDEKRLAVWERASRDRQAGYIELIEINETTLYMLPPFFRGYALNWWEKWGKI
jgi:hypothetical protein